MKDTSTGTILNPAGVLEGDWKEMSIFWYRLHHMIATEQFIERIGWNYGLSRCLTRKYLEHGVKNEICCRNPRSCNAPKMGT